jgi:hypothetical protein
LCEQLGSEPIDSEIPVTLDTLPYEAQQAWQIFDLLPDRFDSMTGSYYGKDFSSLINYYSLFNVEDNTITTLVIRMFDYYETIEISNKLKNRPKTSNK